MIFFLNLFFTVYNHYPNQRKLENQFKKFLFKFDFQINYEKRFIH